VRSRRARRVYYTTSLVHETDIESGGWNSMTINLHTVNKGELSTQGRGHRGVMHTGVL